MMDFFGYYIAKALAKALQSLPVRVVAGVGRFGGGVAYFLDPGHRRVALENLRRCFPQMSLPERKQIAREHFRRLGENFSSAITTAGMSETQIAKHLQIVGLKKIKASPRGAIVAIGHFGNFELYTHLVSGVPHLQGATTYRALEQPRLDGLVREMRVRSGCLFFERHRDVKMMLRALQQGGIVLGLLCDQHAGRKGPRVPFFGYECSTTLAPAKLAVGYELPLFTAICFRVGLGQWRIEIGEEIPTRVGDQARSLVEIMRDVNQAFEVAVRRDLPNSFWVHDRWRFGKKREAVLSPVPPRQPEQPSTDRPQNHSNAAPPGI